VGPRFHATAFASWFLLLGLGSRTAGPATATSSIGVSAIVQASCQASPTATTFPTYTSAAAYAAASVSVNCNHPTAYSVSISRDSAVAPEVRMFKLPLSNAAAGLGIEAALKRGFNARPQANSSTASQEANRPYAIDGARELPRVVTVVITY
jgi:Spore Coat Protein U domain